MDYRYASLYFCMCIDNDDNELEILQVIHHYVEILDRYFGSVSNQPTDLYCNFYYHFYFSHPQFFFRSVNWI